MFSANCSVSAHSLVDSSGDIGYIYYGLIVVFFIMIGDELIGVILESLHRKGQKVIGYSRPLLLWTVTILTASSSVSSLIWCSSTAESWTRLAPFVQPFKEPFHA